MSKQHPWRHPIHEKSISPRIFDTMVSGPLTDRKIDQYSKRGYYANRKYYQGELRKFRATRAIFEPVKKKKLVYNILTQQLEEREVC